jgi:hypothetical protein
MYERLVAIAPHHRVTRMMRARALLPMSDLSRAS